MREIQATEPERVAADPAASRAGFVVTAVLLLLAARLVAAAFLELGPDEAYYLLWSRHLTWSYYDHPPMVAWWIAAGTALFGDSPFAVRVLFCLSAIPISIAVYTTGRVLFDRAIAERAVLWTNATLLIAVGGLLAAPDSPAVLFWALTILAFVLLVSTGKGAWWLLVGACAGLGVVSKLTDLFLGPGILICLLARRDLRHWLASPWLWAGGLLAVAVCVPMVLWNAGHDWITFTKQFSRISTGVFQPEKFPEFIVTQFGVLNPFVAVFAGLAAAIWIRRSPPAASRIGILLWTATPLVFYMAVHSFHEQIQGHWLAPVFPTLALAATAGAQVGGRRWAGLASLTFPVGAVLTVVAFVAAVNPGGAIPYRFDVGQVNRGWDRLAADADALRARLGASWIATTHYAVGAEIGYDLKGGTTPVVTIFERARYAFAPPPDQRLLAEPVLIVTDAVDAAQFARCFAEVTPAGTIPRQSGGETIETYTAYFAKGAAAGLFDRGCDRLPGG